jgi:hypothetical protein
VFADVLRYADVIDTPDADGPSLAWTRVLAAIAVLWVVCVLGLGVAVALAKFALGPGPTAHQQHLGGVLEMLLAMTAVGLPLLAAGTAVAARRPLWACVLVVAAAALTVPAVQIGRAGAHDLRVGRPVPPPPVVTHCIPRSDGGRGCPGG